MPDADASLPLNFRLDDLRIDLARQHVVRDDGEVLDVSGLNFRLLHYLLTQGTQVVSFSSLITNVWAPALVNEETVTQRVRLLRQALGDDGRQARYLRSVRGQGYQLCSEPVAEPALPEAGGDAAPSHRWATLGVAALISVIVAIAWWRWPAAEVVASSPLLQRADYYASIGQRDNNERAMALYRERLKEAPDDVQAQLGIARALAARVCLYSGSSADAERALALAQALGSRHPRLSAAQAVLGYAHDCRGEVDAALGAYQRAVQLDPEADASRASAAYLLARQGRLAEALTANLAVLQPERVRFWQLQVASNLDLLGYTAAAEARYKRSFQLYPDNVFSNIAWPAFLHEHGRNAEAQAALDEALTRRTEHAALYLLATELAVQRGDYAAARSAAQQARALKPDASLPATIAWALDAEAKPSSTVLLQRAAALCARLTQGADPSDGVEAALLATLAGDPRAAIAALKAAVDAGYRNAGYLRVSPFLAEVRTDPDFASLLHAIDTAVAADRARVTASGQLPADARTVTSAR